MHHKRKKPRSKAVVGWGAPKLIQREEAERNQPNPASRKSARRDKEQCKKLHGPHDYVWLKDYSWKHPEPILLAREYRCSACGKKKWEHTHTR